VEMRCPLDEMGRWATWFKASDKLPRYIHIDLGVKYDACGIAMAYCRPSADNPDEPEVIVELAWRLQAPEGTEVNLSRVRQLVLDLRRRGFNIAQVSYDGFQSVDSRQILQRQGFRTKLVSVDRDLSAYETLKELINCGRLRTYRYEPLLKELRSLELVRGRKVDHPPRGSKDVADAVAGAVSEAVRAWGGGLIKAQAEVRRMPFYELLVTDPEGKTVEAEAGPIGGVANPDPSVFAEKEPAKPAGENASAERKPTSAKEETASKTAADAAASPWLVTPTRRKPTKPEPTPGEETAATEHVYATVWANDGTVQPGKTYQYQMRVAVLNPVWSRLEVKDEQARWALQFEGPWSEPGEEVAIPGLVAFYFVGTFGQRVNLELHRWIHGQWIMIPSVPTLLGAPVFYTKRVPISVGGEEITKEVDLSPQMLVVDVVKGFPYKPAGGNRSISTNVLVYADARGSVRERIEWEDRTRATKDRRRRKEAAPPPETGRRSKRSKRTSKR